MIVGTSTCHFASVFYETVWELESRCSFCGKECALVPGAAALTHDLELTLRRWKDGDCSLDDMFQRVNEELYRSWEKAADAAKAALQAGQEPKGDYNPYTDQWTPRSESSEEGVGDER